MLSKWMRSAVLASTVLVAACGQDRPLISSFQKPAPENRSDLLTIQRAAQTVAKKVEACTVGLALRGAMGSGVVVNEEGLILTAAHVVGQPGQDVLVSFPDGTTAKGISLGMHTTADGALVQITDEGEWPFAPMADVQDRVSVGDWCLALGHPRGFSKKRKPPLRIGRIIDITQNTLHTDCTITGGDSGGPLFDMQGRVIGIHSRIAERMSENFHVPMSAMHKAWDRMLDSKLYPDAIPSSFLALLDVNEDGELTRRELKTRLQRSVFDRLVENFELDPDSSINVEELTKDVFKWTERPTAGARVTNGGTEHWPSAVNRLLRTWSARARAF